MLIPGVQAAKPQKVTLMVDDVPVAQVLQALAEQEKLNLVVSPDVSGTVSLHLTDVPWKQALQTVVKSAGLITRQEGNILSVHSIAWQNNNIARQEAEQARAQANLPLENRSITLQYADAGELAKAGEKLLSAKGSMTVDKRTNRLLLRDNKTALSTLEQWVSQMDLPVGLPRISSSLSVVSAVAFDDKAAILLISFCFFGGFSLVNELMQITLNIAIRDTIIGTIFLFFNQIILWSFHGNFHHIHLHHQPDINYRNSL